MASTDDGTLTVLGREVTGIDPADRFVHVRPEHIRLVRDASGHHGVLARVRPVSCRSGRPHGGGPTAMRSFIAAGLVGHLHVVQVPILLGRDTRLRVGLEALEQRYDVEAVSTPGGVTPLRGLRERDPRA